MKSIIIYFSFLIFSQHALAYIPNANMILSKTAINNGAGLYKLEQEVVFPVQPRPLKVLERWFINETKQMKLEVIGLGQLSNTINIHIIYDNGRRYYINAEGSKKILQPQRELPENFLFFKDVNKFKRQLVLLQMAPNQLLNSQKLQTLKNKEHTNPRYIKLTRAEGVVNYTFYIPDSDGKSPRAWVEQDHFLIRKIQFPSQAIFTANSHKRFARGLWHPLNRELLWNGQKILFQTKSVQALALTKKRKKWLLHTSLEKKAALKLPDVEIIKDFYKKFR